MRLIHKHFLFFSLTAMLAALLMAGVLAWNLDRGFDRYLDARDAELLEGFAGDFETFLQEKDAAGDFASDPASLKAAVRQMADEGRIRGFPPQFLRERLEQEGRPFRPFFQKNGPPEPKREEPRPKGPDGPPRMGPPPPDMFARRLQLYDTAGRLIFSGANDPTPQSPSSDASGASGPSEPIRFDGKPVATARLAQRGPAPRSIEFVFLRAQFRGVIIVTGLLLMLSGLFAWFLARATVRKIAAVQQATDAIASGDFAARVETRGSDEIALMGQNINAMAQGLARLESARRRWLAEISHELRTPLTVLRGELNALEDGIRPIDMKAVKSLSEEAQRLNLLIEDLHFMAVSDLGAPSQCLAETDAVLLVEGITARFGAALDGAGLDIETESGPDLALPVVWDRQRIEQLLGNVITNAIRYTDAPGMVRVTLASDEETVSITVEDTVPGVPADQLEQMFEPLHRLEEARDRISGGSGMGLAVARAIAAAHGGTIVAGPSDLGGVKIAITLPVDARTQSA